MQKTHWKDIAEVVGIAAIVASLVFVGLELRQTQNALMASTYQARAFDAMNAERGIADSEYIGPILAKIDFDDEESLDGLSKEEFWRLRRYYNARMIDLDNEYYQYQSGYLDEKFFEGQFKRSVSRVAKRWRRLGVTEMRPEFRELVDELLAEIEAE
jgi:hypothetical protein